MNVSKKPPPPPFRNPPKAMPMETEDKVAFGILAIYAVAMLITFGHAAANVECDPRKDGRGQQVCKVLVGGVAAATWPLYWSWEFFDRRKGGEA